jgi:hypothetical protein
MIGYRLLLLIYVHVILTYQENNANAIWQNIIVSANQNLIRRDGWLGISALTYLQIRDYHIQVILLDFN